MTLECAFLPLSVPLLDSCYLGLSPSSLVLSLEHVDYHHAADLHLRRNAPYYDYYRCVE